RHRPARARSSMADGRISSSVRRWPNEATALTVSQCETDPDSSSVWFAERGHLHDHASGFLPAIDGSFTAGTRRCITLERIYHCQLAPWPVYFDRYFIMATTEG